MIYELEMPRILKEAGVQHFTAEEIAPVGKRAPNRAVLKAPPRAIWQNILPTLQVADWLRDTTGAAIIVSSGYRDPAYNAAVGGAKNSLHIAFNALDVRSESLTPLHLARLATEHPLADQMAIIVYPTFVHIDTRGTLGRSAPIRIPYDGWHLPRATPAPAPLDLDAPEIDAPDLREGLPSPGRPDVELPPPPLPDPTVLHPLTPAPGVPTDADTEPSLWSRAIGRVKEAALRYVPTVIEQWLRRRADQRG